MWWIAFDALAVPVPNPSSAPPTLSLDGYVSCWPSGLAVHAVRQRGASVVSVTTVVEGGRQAENPDEGGAAHLVEHLWFLSKPDGNATVDHVLSALDDQAYTLADATVFLTTGATADLEALMNVEAIRLVRPLEGIDQADFDKARALVRSERVWREGFINDPATDWTRALVPDSRPTSEVTSVDQAKAYAARVYRPEHTTIRIEGDIDPASIDAVVRKTFPPQLLAGTTKSCEPTPAVSAPPEVPAGAPVRIEATVLDNLLVFGWSLPGGYGPADAVAEVGAAWLEEALASAVEAAPRLDPWTADLDCAYEPGRTWSLLACATPLDVKTNPAKVADRIRNVLADRWGRQLDDDELQPIQLGAYLEVLDALATSDDDALSDRALHSHFAVEGIDTTRPLARQIVELDAKGLREWGRTWISGDRMAVVHIAPGKGQVTKGEAWSSTPVLKAPTGPRWQDPAPALAGWASTTLANGLDVWTLPFPVPLAYSLLLFDGGYADGPTGAALAHEITAYPNYAFREDELPKMGTRVWSTVQRSTAAHAGYGLPSNVDLQLYAERIATDEVATWGRPSDVLQEPGVKQKLANEYRDLERVAVDRTIRALFPGHSLGTPEWDHIAATRRLTLADAKAWRTAVFRPDRAVLFVGGAVDAKGVASGAKTYLGSLKAPPGAVTPLLPLPPPPPPAVEAISTDDAMARVLVGCRLPPRDRSHDAAIDLATFLVQEGVSQTLRDQGDLYGVWATSAGEGGTHTTVLLLGAEVAPADGAAALAALTGVLDLVKGGVSERELAWARTAVKLRFARDTSTPWSSLTLSAAAAVHGLSVDDLRAYPRRVDAADAGAVSAVLVDCVGHTIGAYLGPRTDLPGVSWEDGNALHEAIVAAL